MTRQDTKVIHNPAHVHRICLKNSQCDIFYGLDALPES